MVHWLGILWSRRVPLGFLAVALFFCWRIAFTNQILAGFDTFTYFYPYKTYAAQALRQFSLPLWNPHLFMGVPFLANIQVGLFYPLNLFFSILPTPHAMAWTVIVHLALGGMLAYAFGRRSLALSQSGATLFGLCFAFSGFLGGQVGHLNQLCASIWLPALLLSFDESVRTNRPAWRIAGGGAVALTLLAGHTQEAYMSLLVFCLYAAWRTIGRAWAGLNQNEPAASDWLRRTKLIGRMLTGAVRAAWPGILTLAWTISLGAALAAIQLLPTLELAQHSVRSGGLTYRQAVSFSLDPRLFWQSLLPGFLSNPFSEYISYIGFLGLTLALIAILSPPIPHRDVQTNTLTGDVESNKIHFLTGLALTGLLLATGRFFPANLVGLTIAALALIVVFWRILVAILNYIQCIQNAYMQYSINGKPLPTYANLLPQIWRPGLVAIAGLAFSRLGSLPLYALAYGLVPGVAFFRVPARWLFLYTFAVAALAGIGLDTLRRRAVRSYRDTKGTEIINAPPATVAETITNLRASAAQWLRLLQQRPAGIKTIQARLILAALVAIGVTLALRQLFLWPEPAVISRWLMMVIVTGLVIGVGAPLAGRLGYRLALLGLVTLELWAASGDLEYRHIVPEEAYTGLRPAVSRLLSEAGIAGEAGRFRLLSLSESLFDPGDLGEIRARLSTQIAPARITDFVTAVKNVEVLAPNLPLAYHLDSADGYDGGILPLKRYVEFQRLFLPGNLLSTDGRLRENLSGVPEGRLLALMNVRYLLVDKTGDLWIDDAYYDLVGEAIVGAGGASEWQSGPLPSFPTTALGVVSYLEGANNVSDGTTMATITLTGADGRTARYTLDAGNDTAEGEYERSDLPKPRHRQPRIVGNLPNQPNDKLYYARIPLVQPMVIQSITIRPARSSGLVHVRGLSLLDTRTGASLSLPVSSVVRLQKIYDGDVKLYENQDWLPRAFFTPRAQVLENDLSILSAMKNPAWKPTDVAILTGWGKIDRTTRDRLLLATGSGGAEGVTIWRYLPEEVVIETNRAQEGILVLTDSHYPGWRAWVDGQETDILQADFLFRGIYLTPGRHTVVFRHQPVSLLLGMAITFGTAIGLAIWGWQHRRSGKQRGRESHRRPREQ